MSKKLKIHRHFNSVKQKEMEQMDIEVFKIIREFGFDEDTNNRLVVTSLQVADKFNKNHKDVMKSIRNLNCSEQFNERNFALTSIKNKSGRLDNAYLMTRDGFMFLVMGFTGKEAGIIKESYIEKFNILGKWIVDRLNSRTHYKVMTDALVENRLEHGKDTSFFHYCNESDMINVIVLGVNAKKYKEMNEIDAKVHSIRDFLSKEEIYLIDKLQDKNSNLIELDMSYEDRKSLLINYKQRLINKKLLLK